MISAASAGFRQRAAADSGADTLSCNAAAAESSSQPAGTAQNRSTVETTTRRCRRRTALPVQEAAPGSLFVIGQGGRPMLRVIPLDADRQQAPPWRLGLLAGSWRFPMTSARWPPAKSPICRRTAAILLMDKGADHQLDAPLDGLLGRTSRKCSPGWLRINMPPRQGPLLLQAGPRCMRSALEACGTFRQPWGARTQR